jgi:hypothetical protein
MPPDAAAALAESLAGTLDFLRAAEALKTTTRSGHTSAGERESVAEHTWRLCLMALVLHPHFPGVDFARLVRGLRLPLQPRLRARVHRRPPRAGLDARPAGRRDRAPRARHRPDDP